MIDASTYRLYRSFFSGGEERDMTRAQRLCLISVSSHSSSSSSSGNGSFEVTGAPPHTRRIPMYCILGVSVYIRYTCVCLKSETRRERGMCYRNVTAMYDTA